MKKLLTTVAIAMCSLTAAFAQFSGSGTGTESDPYKIYSADQFSQMRNFLNQDSVFFKLMNNLNISDWLNENYPSQGWQPIGSTSEPFKGVLDGNGKTISGFNIMRTSTDYVGLFAAVDGATIKDFNLKGDIKGKAYVGSLFGSGSATVTNYSFEGTVTGTGSYTGGVGGNQSIACSSITVNATVKGAAYTGGIFGKGLGLTSASFTGEVTGTSNTGRLEGQGSGDFSSCTVNAPVTGSANTGGFVGSADSDITFSNCTQQGSVKGASGTGGMVGYAYSSVSASSYTHEGNIEGQENTGGLVGYAGADITFNNNTLRGNVTGTACTGGIIGNSNSGAVTLTSCYAEGDITGTTAVGGICGQIENPNNSSISSCNFWGNISGTSQLGGVVGSITTLCDIDFNATTTAGYKYYNGSYTYSHTACFYKKIPGFKLNGSTYYINGSANDYIASSDINDWAISSHSVSYYYSINNSGHYYSINAPYIVYNNTVGTENVSINVNVLNCSAVGNINGTGAYIGGIVGQDISGAGANYTLSESKTVYYYAGDGVNTTTTSLTLRKYNISYATSDITESYFSGNLTGTNYIGGIAGTKQGGCINKCYSSAYISGEQYVGGIAGSLTKERINTNENSMNSNVSICPRITGTANVGKIYGATDGNFSIAQMGTNSENRSAASIQMVVNGVTQTLNDNLQNGTAVGISQLRLKANYVAWGWDFNTNWTILETETFPYKLWQAAPPTINSNLVSGDTSISGKSTDGGTVYIKIGTGEEHPVNCTGTNFTLTGIAPLQAGSIVQLYTKAADKEASYISQYTVGQGTTPEPEVTKGDLNGDGVVSITDVVLIIDVIAGTITNANQVASADVNGDGCVTITDCVAAIDLIAAQSSAPSQARRKAHTMFSNTDFLSSAMQDNMLTVSLDNEKRYTAFQMIVNVPEGMTLGRATMDEMRGAGHQATVRDLGGGRYLVAGFSSDNEELTGNSGSLLSIVTNGQATDDIVISDIEFSTTKAEAYYLADIAVGSSPTGINEMKNEELRIKNEIFDLQGRRVTKATKGIYIHSGKKTIIK